ncbi:ribosome hibernation-promoting factor, HPF/YfiA family [Abyssisolibacter fermentans]|uniref:ribosome hibernation-promoting factor, HPF/YfiA family n=1 Tax=Abyssisolibacter fermentans TaxID=1766203 RepID=UPI00082DF818|nr:ribosome-associated translation inhibitor RaiA [Abyssisolibacter fermentans]
MKTIISGKTIVITDALKNTVEKKLSKLDKYFLDDVEATATLSVEKNRQIIEVTIPLAKGIIRAEEETDDMYTSLDRVVDVLERQIRKHKTKLQKMVHNGETIRFENIPNGIIEKEAKIVRTKKFAMKPMYEEEAVLQMELLRHAFFVFMNAKTDEVNVVYKRKDGNYGLIEPIF